MIINKIGSKIAGTLKTFTFSKKINKKTDDLSGIENIRIENAEKQDIEKIIEKLNENSKNIHKIKPENIKPLLSGEIERLNNFRKEILIEEVKKTNQEAVVDEYKIRTIRKIITQNLKG